ncbi:MAG: PilZ domain-containing protein [Hyphomonadaceae bacterium]
MADRMKAISGKSEPTDVEYVDTRIRKGKRAPREPVFRQGSLLLPGGQKLQVVLKDLSAGGTRVEFFQRLELPPKVMVVEPSKNIRAWARVVWQREGVAGLEFLPD